MTETSERQIHHVSNSEVQTFKGCKRRWYLSYYRKLRPVKQSLTGALMLGTNVHAALAGYYSPARLTPVATLQATYHTRLEDPANGEAVSDIRAEYDLALAMVEGYLQWLEETGIDDGLTVIDSEVELAAPIAGLPVILIGKLDTRVRRESDGAMFSMDHKTCGSFDSVTKLLDINEQPLTYMLLEKLVDPSQQVLGGMINMLRKVKRTARATPPFFARETIHHNDDELRTFYVQLHSTLTDMVRAEDRLDAGESHQSVCPPSPSDRCSWQCAYRAVCPMLNDPRSSAEGVLASAYEIHNPYARYEENHDV